MSLTFAMSICQYVAPIHQNVNKDTLAMFSWCQSHQNIDILAPQGTNKAFKYRNYDESARKLLHSGVI